MTTPPDPGAFSKQPPYGSPQQPVPGYGMPPGYVPPPPGWQPPPARGTNTLAIVALVTALVVGCLPVGLICGIIALKQIKETGEDGRGLAIAGIVVSAISTLAMVFVLAVFTVGVSVKGSSVHTCTSFTNGDGSSSTSQPC